MRKTEDKDVARVSRVLESEVAWKKRNSDEGKGQLPSCLRRCNTVNVTSRSLSNHCSTVC